VADAAGPTRQQLTPVAYWADAEANSVAIQLLWPRVPAWHTSAHCEGPQGFRRVECQGEPEMATRQHQARAGEGLPFCADRRSKKGRANRTSVGPCRGHPARSRTCGSASMLPRALASVAMRIANPFITITHVIGSLRGIHDFGPTLGLFSRVRKADVGQQSADTIKLNFRFRCPGAGHEVKVGDQTHERACHLRRGTDKPLATAWPPKFILRQFHERGADRRRLQVALAGDATPGKNAGSPSGVWTAILTGMDFVRLNS
jgi:hypothetical protein